MNKLFLSVCFYLKKIIRNLLNILEEYDWEVKGMKERKVRFFIRRFIGFKVDF